MQYSHHLPGSKRIAGESGNLAIGGNPALGDTFYYFLDSLFKRFGHNRLYFLLQLKIRQFRAAGYHYLGFRQ